MINYSGASKQQLLTIAFDETNSLEDRYEAVKELESRKVQKHWKDYMISSLVLMWARGASVGEIAKELRVNPGQVGEQAKRLQLWKTRLQIEKGI
ncbi:hypothetical protein [Priestia megaterium]|uniref:hypothetical protein n=1 Tax=Priestia megaterium TaxID=1404 RepID=UPI000CA127DE|nr:hypothetical protein [Priestia megaterium]AUO14770.1 hypothetical protein C0569_26140 [Priestia megaterium]